MHARGNRAGVKVTTRENRMELTAHSVKAAQWLKIKRSFLTRDYIEVTACAKYKYLSRKIVLGTHSICWPVLELKTGRRTKGGAAGTRRVQVAPSSTACCPTSYIEKRRRWHSNLIVVSASEEGAAAAHAHTICLSLWAVCCWSKTVGRETGASSELLLQRTMRSEGNDKSARVLDAGCLA